MVAGAARAGDDDGGRQDLRGKDHRRRHEGHGRHQHGKFEHRLSRALAAGRAAQARSAAAGLRGLREARAELAEGPRREAPQGRDRRAQEGKEATRRSATRDQRCRRPSAVAERAQRRAARRPIRTTSGPRIRSKPGDPGGTPLSPSQLGYDGGFMGMFKGSKTESAEFKAEPPRDVAGAAAARLPDAVVELPLRHRAEGIPEQGIQSGVPASTASNACIRDGAG